MAIILICSDKRNSEKIRYKNRNKHLEYLKKFESSLLLAGPILSQEGMPIGSLIVLDFNENELANDFIKNDPYNLAGLFENISIKKFKKVF